jgi:hypothetical protein
MRVFDYRVSRKIFGAVSYEVTGGGGGDRIMRNLMICSHHQI